MQLPTPGMRLLIFGNAGGGFEAVLQRFTEHHAEFIENLPAMALQGDNLLVHADTMVYVNHGISIVAVNECFHRLMLSPGVDQWLRTLEAFAEHMAFSMLGTHWRPKD